MFNKKCSRCGRKINRDYDFCPYCGSNIRREKEERNFGFLGRDDELNLPDLSVGMPFGFNKIFNSLLKQIDKQFKELDREIGKDVEKAKYSQPEIKTKGISISISSATGEKPEIKVRGFGPGFENLQIKEQPEIKTAKTKLPEPRISEYKARKLAKLPREEAETNVRRLSNKIIYEINLPGVSSLANLIINKLENSTEIKAFTKDKVYFKLLPVNLPILNYQLEKEKLILELGTRS